MKGLAAEAVKGFAVIKDNYQPVLESLKEQFGHPQLILDAHTRSLIHLSHLTAEDALSMRKFYDQVVGHVCFVESMGEKFGFETLAPVLVPLIVDKLPKGVVEKWQLEIGDHKEDYVKVKTLFAFLEQLIRAKESYQPHSLQSRSPAQENSWNHGAHSKSNPSRKYSTSALCTTGQGRACIVCGKNHWVWSCISFLSLPAKERFRKAVSKGLCFRCLESGHRTEVCQKPLCKYCRGKHHSLLHLEPVKSQPEEANSKSSESPSSSAIPPSSSSIVASSSAVNSGGKVILQTVPAVLCGSNGCKRLSDVSLIPAPKRPLSNRVWLKSLVLMGRP